MIHLQSQFGSRAELAAYLHTQFPAAAAHGSQISPTRGGRRAAEVRLQQIRPQAYAATRNMLNGAVTHLSAYLRYGVVTLAEVRREVLKHAPESEAHKLLQELSWRDYYQRVYQRLGNAIWSDIAPYKTGVIQYAQSLPVDIEQGKTGLTCIDTFAHELRETGYLHNHARLWTAAYVVHHRRVRWQAGAFWFLQHLLDGDPASNNLSWQWVASTFAIKPYYFDRQNLARYTENAFCAVCPLAQQGCPFDASYEELAARLFPERSTDVVQHTATLSALMQQLANKTEPDNDRVELLTAAKAIVWMNEECLHPSGPALRAHPDATRIFIFDEAAIEDAQWTLKRIMFVYECLLEIAAVQIYKGSPAAILRQLVAQQQQQAEKVTIATTQMLDPRLQQIMVQLKEHIHVEVYAVEAYLSSPGIRDLRSFSRYWKQIEHSVMNSEEEKS